MSKTRESKVIKYFKKKLRVYRGDMRKIAFINRTGCPDNLVGVGNFAGLVEFKATFGAASVRQCREHKELRDMGFLVEIVDSLKAVDRFFATYCPIEDESLDDLRGRRRYAA